MSAAVPFSDALRLDAELVRIAGGASAVRLDVGAALNALVPSGDIWHAGQMSGVRRVLSDSDLYGAYDPEPDERFGPK